MRWKEGPRRQSAEKTKRARVLRRHMTDAERCLWRVLQNRNISGIKFRRQVPFGPYYLDFYSAEANIAIELDGGQHYTVQGKKRDAQRDTYARSLGIKVIRYSDRDVLLHLEEVLEEIRRYLHESSP